MRAYAEGDGFSFRKTWTQTRLFVDQRKDACVTSTHSISLDDPRLSWEGAIDLAHGEAGPSQSKATPPWQ